MQIDVAVNAPEAGTIKEILVSEEDTVVVGQEIIRLELGDAPSGGEKAPQQQEATKEAPEATEKQAEPKEESKQQKPEPRQEEKPQPPKQPKEEKPQAKSAQAEVTTQAGPSREERRVCDEGIN
jgi:2-oxoglutarate dehydrogenase E2 component (dihydrolipoamide succinyltransferase)